MQMKVMYVPMIMYLTAGSSKMSMSIFHPRKQQEYLWHDYPKKSV